MAVRKNDGHVYVEDTSHKVVEEVDVRGAELNADDVEARITESMVEKVIADYDSLVMRTVQVALDKGDFSGLSNEDIDKATNIFLTTNGLLQIFDVDNKNYNLMKTINDGSKDIAEFGRHASREVGNSVADNTEPPFVAEDIEFLKDRIIYLEKERDANKPALAKTVGGGIVIGLALIGAVCIGRSIINELIDSDIIVVES